MSLFYFVGGPIRGHADEFFMRLVAVGGTPRGWQVFPHASPDNKALHIVRVDSAEAIATHLSQFADIYETTPPVELVDTPKNKETEDAHAGA